MRLRRSVLITPANNWTFLEKASTSPADVSWLELEDGVHPTRKTEARDMAVKALQELDWGTKERIVRVNPMYTEDGPKDITAITLSRPDAFLLTKVQDPSEVEQADRLISEIEESNEGDGVKIWCMIETAKGLVNVERIATASERVAALFFGGGDLSADLRVKRIGLGKGRVLPDLQGLQVELLYGRSRTVAAARAAGVGAIDVVYNDFRDLEATYLDALYSFQLGFDGKMVLSPAQIPAVHRAFAPSEDDLNWAQRVVAASEDAAKKAETVTVVDNEMVDGPFVLNAEAIIKKAEDIARADSHLTV